MRREELEILIEPILPSLYGLSFALAKNVTDASQVLIDAYTVYLLREKDYIADLEINLDSQRSRLFTKKFLKAEILREIYQLAHKKNRYLKISKTDAFEFEHFFELTAQKRAILYLKEVEKLSIEDIQEVFKLQRHQVIELLHNSLFGIMKDMKKSKRAGAAKTRNAEHFEGLISSYVNDTIKLSDREKVEALIAADKDLNEIYQQKILEKDFHRQLIPAKKMDAKSIMNTLAEIKRVNDNCFPKGKFPMIQRVVNYLKEPAIEFEV